MDSLKPLQIVEGLIDLGVYKSRLTAEKILIRGFMSGALLSIATVLAYTVYSQSGIGYLGALAFPVGFVMIMLLGLELVTGNFATIPMAIFDGQCRLPALLKNWSKAFIANLLGSLFFASLYAFYVTKAGTSYHNVLIEKINEVAFSKTIAYKEMGMTGWLIAFVKAFICNWMVTFGVVMALASASTIGKIAAIWLPIFTFFALGLEHAVVNMFVLPTAMLFDAPITLSDWWFWNQIPVTLGNIAGAFLLTACSLYFGFKKRTSDDTKNNT